MVDLRFRLIIGLAFFVVCLGSTLVLYLNGMNEPALVTGGMAATAGIGLGDMLRAKMDKNGKTGRVSDPVIDPDKTPREKP